MTVHGPLENWLGPRVAPGIGRRCRYGWIGRGRRLILAMLALGAMLCAMPEARARGLSCPDEPSASPGQERSEDPIKLSGDFTCAPLTSPEARDVIVVSKSWFLPKYAERIYFYAYDEFLASYGVRTLQTLIKLPGSSVFGGTALTIHGRPNEQYFSEIHDRDCTVNGFYIFGQSATHSKTVLIAIENERRDLSGLRHKNRRPTKLTAFLLKKKRSEEFDEDEFEFDEVATRVLKKYYCTKNSVLPEVKAFKTDIAP